MSFRDLLPNNNECDHPVVKFDEFISNEGHRSVEVGCDDCGSAAFEFGQVDGTFLADRD